MPRLGNLRLTVLRTRNTSLVRRTVGGNLHTKASHAGRSFFRPGCKMRRGQGVSYRPGSCEIFHIALQISPLKRYHGKRPLLRTVRLEGVAEAGMKILQIVSSSRLSGAEKHVAVLSESASCSEDTKLRRFARPEAGCLTNFAPRRFPSLRCRCTALARGRRRCACSRIHSRTEFRPAPRAPDLRHLLRLPDGPCEQTCPLRLPFMSAVATLCTAACFPRRGNHIITVSDWVREGFVTQGVPSEQVHTIYNGTEFSLDNAVGGNSAPGQPGERKRRRTNFCLPAWN